MLRDILPIMSTGVDMRLMGNMALGEQPVQLARAGVKAVHIVIAAVKINSERLKIRSPGKDERGVRLPEALVQRRAESRAQKSRQADGGSPARKLLQQRRH